MEASWIAPVIQILTIRDVYICMRATKLHIIALTCSLLPFRSIFT